MNRAPVPLSVRLAALVLVTGLAGLACAAGDADAPPTPSASVPASTRPPAAAAGPGGTALIPIRNARIPMDGVLSGGQPTEEQIEAAARAGFRTVINLRTEGEPGFEWERDLVERLGMTYVHIPVGGAETLTRETIAAIDAALREARARGPVLYHCASGNRIGASLALRAAWIDDRPPGEAFDLGVASGMTRLAEPVGRILGVRTDAAPR